MILVVLIFLSSSYSTEAEHRSSSPFRRQSSEEKKAEGDDKKLSSSSLPAINSSHASAGYVVARRGVLNGGVTCAYDVMLSAMLLVLLVAQILSHSASVGMKSVSKWIVAAANVGALPLIYDLFEPSLLPSVIARLVSQSLQSRRVVEKLEGKLMG
ncbi:uncharacterized protein MONOS_7855 [Monocercomonoides exilis]|uniref:uncharacterized protein n=1 Tax=Monocercomonoides exilis TaxID=2049356 RepID=UPI00355AA1FD|nr:hypothetical protein MONOS_7855 [Monocercomonoides exilis]|eukprot:MONOS_7855.1-p1 / transcript=MONOS_7855.1 / gene=MONOS_7855 / organism=Monocercomonoides_exilis_PA203 / gene_product=unspecified product / transcript_product=unspecified product / location=Mono_scaffold00280:46558-47133(+) / protein_length=156 / sequence_SO=supercontig / SO=protein_coding / is_pseudo=false